ncbi:MAG: hypothetical protein AAF533_28385 [Acidobacteriota bacterium]
MTESSPHCPRRLAALLSLALILAPASPSEAEVLLVGHSQVNHQVPGYLEWVLESAGTPEAVERQVIGGGNLEEAFVLAAQFTDAQDPAIDPDGRYFYWPGRLSGKGADALAELDRGVHDHVILTEEHGLTQAQSRQLSFRIEHGVIFPPEEDVSPGSDAFLLGLFQPTHGIGSGLGFYDRAVRARPTARVHLYENFFPVVNGATHCDRLAVDAPTKTLAELDSWRRRVAAYRPAWEGLAAEMNQRIGETVPGFTYGTTVIPETTVASGEPVVVIPVAQALSVLCQRACEGRVGSLDDPNELWLDHVHLNWLGNYFVALVMYAAIEERSPEGIALVGDGIGRSADGDTLDTPDPDVAAAMQSIAWEVVSGTTVATTEDIPSCLGLGVATREPQLCIDPGDTELIPDYGDVEPIDPPGSVDDLRIARAATEPGRLDLSWGTGCSASVVDYTVLEGELGRWFDSGVVTCSTGGSVRFDDHLPSGGSRYFLIVPVSALAEGHPGRDSFGRVRVTPVGGCREIASLEGCR